MSNKYMLPAEFQKEAPRVVVVGAGGTGSAVLAGLAQMCIALEALGAPGLDVVVYDDDKVSTANIGRQAFAPCDVGDYKAETLVNRINQTYGLQWEARAVRLKPPESDRWQSRLDADILIGCVDTRIARHAIHQQWGSDQWSSKHRWWVDCGNTSRTGQVVLGVYDGRNKGKVLIPSVGELFPEMVDPALDATDDAPSCSLPEALAKQDLFTNRFIANAAKQLLWQLFRYGESSTHGAFINLETMRMTPLAIDSAAWERMGWVAQTEEAVEA